MKDFDLPPLKYCICGKRPYSGKEITYYGNAAILHPYVRCTCGREVIGQDCKAVFEEWNKMNTLLEPIEIAKEKIRVREKYNIIGAEKERLE